MVPGSESPAVEPRWSVLDLAPAGLSSCSTKSIKHKTKDSIISVATLTAPEEIVEIVSDDQDAILHHTSVALVANSSNWRKVVKELIGDEPVSYVEKSKKDSLRKFPIVTILSTDKEALARVLTKAAEVE